MFGNNAGPRGGYRPPQQPQDVYLGGSANFNEQTGKARQPASRSSSAGMPAFPGYQQPQKTVNMLDPRYAGGMPPPPRPVYESPDFGNDIRRPPSGTPPAPPPPAPGRVMDGPGSGFTYNPNMRDGGPNDTRGQRPGYGNDTYYLPQNGTGGGMPPPNPYIDQGGPATAGPYGPPPGGFPPPPSRPPPVTFRPGQANSIQPQAEESPEEYRRSIMAERARAAKMDAAAAAKRQKMQQNRQGTKFDGYDNPVYDPMVAENEQQKIYREQRAAGRGEKPRKTQMELEMESRRQEHERVLAQRSQVQGALPGVDEATQRAVRQRMSAYGETPEQAFQNGGFAARQSYARSQMADGPQPRQPAGQSRWR